ncbi:MAG: O-antigen ligase family protein [Spirochaetota bacterium]
MFSYHSSSSPALPYGKHLYRALFLVPLLLSFIMKTEAVTSDILLGRIIKSLMLFSYLLLILTIFLTDRHTLIRLKIDQWLILAYMICCLFSEIVIHHTVTVRSIGFSIELPVIYLGITMFFRSVYKDAERDSMWVLNITLALLFIHIIIGFIMSNTLLVGHVSNLGDLRSVAVKGLFDGTNKFGFVCMAAGMIASSLFLKHLYDGKPSISLIYALVAVVSLYSIFRSISRGSLFGFGIYCIVMLILLLSKPHLRDLLDRKVIYTGMALFALIAGILTFSGILHSFIEKFKFGSTLRFSFWMTFLGDYVSRFPGIDTIFGSGFDAHSINPYPKHVTLHSMYLEHLGRSGLVGFLLIGSILWIQIKKLLSLPALWYLVGIPAGYLAHAVFEAKIIVGNTNTAALFFLIILALPHMFWDRDAKAPS